MMDDHRNGLLHRAYYSRWTPELGRVPVWKTDARSPLTASPSADLRELTGGQLEDAIRA